MAKTCQQTNLMCSNTLKPRALEAVDLSASQEVCPGLLLSIDTSMSIWKLEFRITTEKVSVGQSRGQLLFTTFHSYLACGKVSTSALFPWFPRDSSECNFKDTGSVNVCQQTNKTATASNGVVQDRTLPSSMSLHEFGARCVYVSACHD